MTMRDQIQSLKELISRGEHKKSHVIAEKLLKEECTVDEKNEIMLHKSLILIRLGELVQAAKILDDFEKIHMNKKLKRIWFNSKAYLLYSMGAFKECRDLFTEINEYYCTIEEIDRDDEKFLIDFILYRAQLSGVEKNWKEMFDWILEGLEKSKKIEFQKGINDSQYAFSVYFLLKGELDTAYEYGIRALDLRKKMGDKESIILSKTILANIEWGRNNYGEALDFYQKALKIAQEIGSRRVKLLTQINMAELKVFRGNLDEALKLYEKSLTLCEKMGNKWMYAGILQGIAAIHYYKGDLENAIHTYEKANSIFEEVPYMVGIIEGKWNLAKIYAFKGDFTLSQRYFLDVEHFYQEYENSVLLAQIYDDLIALYVDNRELNKAKEIFEKLVKINDQTEIVNVEIITKNCEALILKTSKKFRDVGKAEELLRETLKADIFDFESQFETMLSLCEILLLELEFSSDEEILAEITDLITKMEQIARTANSQILLINILTLKGKFALFTDGSNKALEVLDQALLISQDKGLEKSSKEITQEIEFIQKNIDNWLDTFSKNIPLAEKLEPLKLKEYLKATIQIVHAKKWTYEPTHDEKCTVFISYAVADSNKFEIQNIAKLLEVKSKINKVYCWELWDGFPDGSIIKFMETGIRDSQFFLPVFTDSYSQSINCQKEYEAALAVNKSLIPIFAEIDHVPVLCRARMGVDTSKLEKDKVIDEIYKLIEATLQHKEN